MGATQGIGCLGLPKAEKAGDLAAIDRSCAFRVGCILEARVCEPRGDACTKTCRFLERLPFASTCGVDLRRLSPVSSADWLTARTRGLGALDVDNGIVTASHRKVEHGSRRVVAPSRRAMAGRRVFGVVERGRTRIVVVVLWAVGG